MAVMSVAGHNVPEQDEVCCNTIKTVQPEERGYKQHGTFLKNWGDVWHEAGFTLSVWNNDWREHPHEYCDILN